MDRQLLDLSRRVLELERVEIGIIGTFTPIVAGSGGGGVVTYTTQNGQYNRTGRQVVASFAVVMNTVTSAPAGDLRIGGLPFTARSGSPNGGVILGFTDTTLSTIVRGIVVNNATYCQFYTAAGVAIAASLLVAGSHIQGVAIYDAA